VEGQSTVSCATGKRINQNTKQDGFRSNAFCFQTVEKSFFQRGGSGSVGAVMKRTGLILGVLAAMLCGRVDAEQFFPFYDNMQTDEGSFFTVRPFYSKTTVEEGKIQDFLWPLYSRKEFKDEATSRALIFWWTHHFETDSESPRQRNWLLPFYFQGRDKNAEPYFAIFPLGGTIHDFLGRDKIAFALFPMLGKSQINEVKTTSVLWPIYSKTRGDGIRRDRVFPIVGKSVLEDKYEKRFVLWPFWTSAQYFYPGDSGSSWILFPICGRSKLDKESTWWVIPPFFRFTAGEREDRLLCPWPFVQKTKSATVDKFYLWPLWGRKQAAGGRIDRSFALWPVLWSETFQQKDVTVSRKKALPFFFYEEQQLREPDQPEKERPVVSKGWKIWPLMSWQQAGEMSRFRMLELWPLNSAPIERNWSPLWTLYKRTHADGVTQKDLLWFIWHSEKEPEADRTEWSLLKGLLGYKKDRDLSTVRFLWLDWGDE
jgi:hypothetical protein